MTEALDLILEDLDELIVRLEAAALEASSHTVMVGRSHGIHGEPISFGFKLAIWYEEACRHRTGSKRLEKISRWANSRERWAPSRIKVRKSKSMSAPRWGWRRTRSPIKSCSATACGLCLGIGAAGGQHRKNRHGDSPSATDGGAGGGGIFFRGTEGLLGDAAQTESDRLGKPLRLGTRWCAATVWRRWKMSPSGTSVISAIPRSSG